MTPTGPRVALVGAASLLGQEITSQLAASGLPSESVTLLDLEEIAGMVTEYGDEARVMVEAAADDLLLHDVVCFVGDPQMADEHLPHLLRHDRIGIDCTGAWTERDEALVWLPGSGPAPSLTEHRAIALPGAATILLGSTLAALGSAAADAVATVLMPASEAGEAGLHELSQQSSAVMNIEGIEHDVFGRQRAFDLWPAAVDGTARVAAELLAAGMPVPRLSVIAAPVFHGTSATLYLPDGDAASIEASLREAGIPLDAPADGGVVDSPLRVTGRAGIHAAGLRDDADGAWVWLTIDNLNARAAAAVAAVHAVLGPLPAAPTATV